MDNKFKRIIEFKKQKGSNRKPRYATRKLSIGLVSCMLGYALLVSPSSVEAAELDSENQAVAEESAETETKSEENLTEENKETPAEGSVEEETPAPAEKEKPAETTENTEAPKETEKTEEAPEEEAVVEDKEVFTLSDVQRKALKDADYTDSEIEKIEEEIAKNVLADASFDVEAFLDEKVAEKAPALEMGEENKPEAVAAPADENRAPKDISNEVTNINGSIEGLTNKDATTIKPIGQDTNLEGKDYDTQAEAILSFNVPNSTIEGDYVDITLSNNVNINGIVENVQPGQLDAYFGPEKIATASYDKATRTIRYTFTKAVESYGNVKVNTRFPLFIDKNVVTAPKSEQTIGVKVGDNAPIERTYTVDYHMDNIGGNDKYVSNGYSDITNVNREEGTYDHTIYINPLGKDQRGTKLTIENLPDNSGVIFDQEVLDNVKLYVVKDPGNLALSFAWDPDNLVEVGADGYTKTLDGDKIVLNIRNKVDPLKPNKPDVIRGDSVLVARYEGKFKNDAFDDAATRVTFDNGTPARADNYHWDNIIYTTDADASGTGDEEMGYFEDYHVYQTINADGTITTDGFKFVPQQQGPESKKYETVKIDREGYELVSVESPDGAAFDEHGAKTTGNFVNGKTLHVKYVYQKRPVEKKGSFQEHHIYQTKKLDGTIVEDSRVDKDVTEGTEKENYKTSKEDKDGYTLIEVKSANGGQFNKDGSEKEAAYIADTKQEVTYIYQKEEVEKKGSFQEHHIYQTKKLDGTIVEDSRVDKDVTEGTEKENYKTSKEDKDGYTLIEVKSANGGQFNKDGSEKEAAYIADTKQEVTYIYQKEEVEKKGSFQEHHIYQTKKLDGTIVEDSRVDKDVTEGTEKENYKTSKEDKDGYTLIEVKSANGGQFNKDGSEKEAAYIADTKQEVTYIYQKEEVGQTPLEETGKFQEHHIYITKDKDGKEIKREVVDGKVSGGTKDMTYTTGKKDKDGFKFVRTEDAKENPSYDKDGKETKGNYKPGVTQEITYVYERTEVKKTPLEETGKFQEHHIYITKDKDGKEIKREVVDGEVSGGTKDMTYTTGKKDKDGFKFVRTEDAKENPSYDKDGKETKGNYKPGVTQEITYVYEKTESEWTPIEETGKFQEHHIYITKDKDGKEIGREVVDGEVSGGTKDMTYTTGKKDKDGFKFVRTEDAKENPSYDKDGKETKGNYKPGVTQEITYVYEKTESEWTPIEETGKFQEHHIYITKDKDGKEIGREVVDGKVSGGTKDMTYTTGKDEKDGFKFVRTENPVEEPSYNEQGEETKGNYKPGVTQEITYVYEKTESEWTPIEETGKFQEHHIYITKDKDGKEIKREVVDGKVSGGTKDMTYTTGKVDKDGFKFVRTEDAKENPSYDKDGKETTGNYKPGVTQEITYVYEKTETPWTPLEPSEPIEKDPKDPEPGKPGKEDPKDPTPTPGKPEPNKPEGNTPQGVKVPKVTGEKTSTKVERKSNNPKMGVESASGVIASLVAATGAMFASRKKKEDEDK